jgi:hypothetical protein
MISRPKKLITTIKNSHPAEWFSKYGSMFSSSWRGAPGRSAPDQVLDATPPARKTCSAAVQPAEDGLWRSCSEPREQAEGVEAEQPRSETARPAIPATVGPRKPKPQNRSDRRADLDGQDMGVHVRLPLRRGKTRKVRDDLRPEVGLRPDHGGPRNELKGGGEHHQPERPEHRRRRSLRPRTHPHPERVADQVRGIGQPGLPPTVAGSRHQHHEHLVFVLAAKRLRVAGQQPSVAALQMRYVGHVATTPLPRLSRVIATEAFDCNRPASSASRCEPAGVSR